MFFSPQRRGPPYEPFHPPYMHTDERRKTQNSDLSFEIQEPIIVNPVKKEAPKIDIREVDDQEPEDS